MTHKSNATLRERLLKAYSGRSHNSYAVIDAPDLYEIIGMLQDGTLSETAVMSNGIDQNAVNGQAELTRTQSAEERTVTDAMVDRFLAWKLPKDFAPDGGISFVPSKTHPDTWPIGTNLFTAVQAKEMLAHVTGPLQAQIDRLMLEYCPDEMTEAQTAEWAKHQVSASPEASAQIDAAIGRTASSEEAGKTDPTFFDGAMTLRNRYFNDEITGSQLVAELEKLHLRCVPSAIGEKK